MSNPPVQLRWTHKLILAGLSILFALVLVEIAGHALGLLPALSDAQYRAVIRRAGTLRPPYDHFTTTGFVEGNTEFKVDIRLNKLGFRGDDIATPPPQGSQRLLVMGDSYTAGWEVKEQDMWSAWLSRELNTGGDQAYDVANIGFPGLGTDREYLLYQAYGRTLEPDVVILVMYVENDVNDNGIALWTSPDELVKTRPYFTLDERGNLVEHPWRYVDRTRSYERESFPRSVTGWLNAHSLTYRVLRNAAREGWSAVTGNEDKKSSPAAENDQPADLDHPTRIPQPLEVMFTEPDEKWEQAWQITGELLRSFRAAVEADGARLVVVIVPPHMIVQNEYWPYADLFDASGRAWDVWYPQTRMLALLDELDIPALNPTQGFIDFRRATGKALFFIRDRHFNPTGTCVFGTLLANWLADQEIVTPDAAAPRDPLEVCS